MLTLSLLAALGLPSDPKEIREKPNIDPVIPEHTFAGVNILLSN